MRPDEAQQKKLYEFDWDVSDWGVQLPESQPESGTEIGWWNGNVWTALYGEGIWSPLYVTEIRPVFLIIGGKS